jgi:hypothetical protein
MDGHQSQVKKNPHLNKESGKGVGEWHAEVVITADAGSGSSPLGLLPPG